MKFSCRCGKVRAELPWHFEQFTHFIKNYICRICIMRSRYRYRKDDGHGES